VRTAAPAAEIFVVVPPSGAKRSAITAAFASYQATPDLKCYLVDGGVGDQTGLGWTPGSATAEASDGVHPYAATDAAIEAHVWSLIQAQIGTILHSSAGGGAGPVPWASSGQRTCVGDN
jgi:hypothetical protein